MGLLVWLIILLAIAWGVADFQLQGRIEPAPPPLPVPKSAPAAPLQADVAPPVENVPVIAPNPSAEGAPAAAPEAAITPQDPRTGTPQPDKTPQ